jgi:hypothetical protein
MTYRKGPARERRRQTRRCSPAIHVPDTLLLRPGGSLRPDNVPHHGDGRARQRARGRSTEERGSHAGPEQTRRKGHFDEGESPQLRLQETVRERGLDVFALIDHSGAAEQVGLTMQEAELLIFDTAPHTKEN